MSTSSPQPPAGWYPDPQGDGNQRWWNGVAWADQTRPAPVPPPPASPFAAPGAHPGAPYSGAQYPGAPYSGARYPASQPPYAGAARPGYDVPSGYQAQSGYGYAPVPPIGAWRSAIDDRPTVTGMGGAIRTVFAKYAVFEGRASRAEYWWWILFYSIIVAGGYLLAAIAGVGLGYGRGPGTLFGLIYLLFVVWMLVTVVPYLALSVRRLRDAGYHWGFLFLSLIPFGGIAVLVMSAQPSRHP
ncbi:hypothetical protein GCM10022240_23530 [Microbacterium kribbense]|uniref:DUF2510 domain-containing protein n=1 Tax=Microbacterium kribbense TaxID=433645 RepID=A0ABP7GNV0_9MICO